EAVLVVEAVVDEAPPGAGQHLVRLADHGRLDTAARDPARHLPKCRDSESGARIARGGADALDDGPEGDLRALCRPALPGVDDVFHELTETLLMKITIPPYLC